jgi:uncharacterized protein (DUF1330 family)
MTNRMTLCCLSYTLLMLSFVTACSDNSGNAQAVRDAPAQAMVSQFGDGAFYFSESGMRQLLDLEDKSSPIVLMQLITVEDPEGFARYEVAAQAVWDQHAASVHFASRVIGQISGERPITEVRAIEFANAAMLIDAFNSEGFANAMTTLMAATSDHVWVLGPASGVEDPPCSREPPEYPQFPRYQNLNREEAVALLAVEKVDDKFLSNDEVLIDMLVSDSRDPVYMVELLDFYEWANYPDGRDSDVTGASAYFRNWNFEHTFAQYFIRDTLQMKKEVVLTEESPQWDSVKIRRYPTRDHFLSLFALNSVPGRVDFSDKEAGLEDSLLYVTERDCSVGLAE